MVAKRIAEATASANRCFRKLMNLRGRCALIPLPQTVRFGAASDGVGWTSSNRKPPSCFNSLNDVGEDEKK